MGIVWVAANLAGEAEVVVDGVDIGPTLEAVGWTIIQGVAFWFASQPDPPVQPYGVALNYCSDPPPPNPNPGA